MAFPSEILIGAIRLFPSEIERIKIHPDKATITIHFRRDGYTGYESLCLLTKFWGSERARKPHPVVFMFPDSCFSGDFYVFPNRNDLGEPALNTLFLYMEFAAIIAKRFDYESHLIRLMDRINRED